MQEERLFGRFEIVETLGKGGSATVDLAVEHDGSAEPAIVALKRLHPVEGVEWLSIDEARVLSRVRHPNVGALFQVIPDEDEIVLVLEYVHGMPVSELLHRVRKRDASVPVAIAAAIVHDLVVGLSAAHEATGEDEEPLGVVHRDVAPGNVVVGIDGAARLIDFGVAKARDRLVVTTDGRAKGKLPYLAPELLRGGSATPASDVYAAGVVLWETLACAPLFRDADPARLATKILAGEIEAPSAARKRLGVAITADDDASIAALDRIVARATRTNPEDRYRSARDMARDLEAVDRASRADVTEWLLALAGEDLDARDQRLRAARAIQETKTRAAIGPAPTLTRPVPVAAREPEPAPAPAPARFAPRRPSRVRSRHVLPAVAAIATAAIVIVVGFALTSGDPPPRPPATTSAIAPAASSSSSTAPTAAIAPAPSAASSDDPPPVASAASPSARPHRHRPRPTRSAPEGPAAAPPSCDVPYEWKDGVRVFRPECAR